MTEALEFRRYEYDKHFNLIASSEFSRTEEFGDSTDIPLDDLIRKREDLVGSLMEIEPSSMIEGGSIELYMKVGDCWVLISEYYD